MNRQKIKQKAVSLRKRGRTYSEIQEELNASIPKSTLSNWCASVKLSRKHQDRISKIISNNAKKGREKALIINKKKREEYLKSITDNNKHLLKTIEDVDVAKIALASLYLGEGCKTRRGALMFGNSNPFTISFFLRLLRQCYNIDESKFRCTVQCRADQNIKKLENFWFRITDIPLSQFYKARVDPRTENKPSKKKDYKGVCRIDYFSAEIFLEILQIIKIIQKGR